MIHSDTHSSLRSCNVSIFKGLVCGFMPDLCMWGNFFFHLRFWIITTWAIIFLNRNLAFYLKHLFSLWHGSMLLVLSNVPFFFLNYLFDFFFLGEAVSRGLQFINWKRGHSDREKKLIKEQNWNSRCQLVLFHQIKCRVQNKRILTRYLRITVRSHHG